MRFLLLFLSLFLQLNISGYANYNPQKNHAIKILTSETSDCNRRSYVLFRYYDPGNGNYISQDPIRLAGGNNLYGYVINPNAWLDIFGLKGNNPVVVRGQNNRPESATATVTPDDIKTGGSGTNASSRARSEQLGNYNNDDAGHILGNKLGGQGGVDNVFPQDPSTNRGAYRTFEAGVAKDIMKNGSADISWTFQYGDPDNPDRPTKIEYVVMRDDEIVMQEEFENPCG